MPEKCQAGKHHHASAASLPSPAPAQPVKCKNLIRTQAPAPKLHQTQDAESSLAISMSPLKSLAAGDRKGLDRC